MGCGASSVVPGSDCTKPGNVYNPGLTPRDDDEPKKKKKEKKEKKEKAEDASKTVAPVDGGSEVKPKEAEPTPDQKQESSTSVETKQDDIAEAQEAQPGEEPPKSEGLSTNAQRKLSVIGCEKRRSICEEDAEWMDSEAEQKRLLDEASAPPAVEPAELAAPEFEEAEGEYVAELVPEGGDMPAAPDAAPVLETTDGPENDQRRKSLSENVERRSSAVAEDEEWAASEAEQRKQLEGGATTAVVDTAASDDIKKQIQDNVDARADCADLKQQIQSNVEARGAQASAE